MLSEESHINAPTTICLPHAPSLCEGQTIDKHALYVTIYMTLWAEEKRDRKACKNNIFLGHVFLWRGRVYLNDTLIFRVCSFPPLNRFIRNHNFEMRYSLMNNQMRCNFMTHWKVCIIMLEVKCSNKFSFTFSSSQWNLSLLHCLPKRILRPKTDHHRARCFRAIKIKNFKQYQVSSLSIHVSWKGK